MHSGSQAVVDHFEKDVQACIPAPTEAMEEAPADVADADEKNDSVDDMLDACNDLYEQIDASVDKSAKAIEHLSPEKKVVAFSLEQEVEEEMPKEEVRPMPKEIPQPEPIVVDDLEPETITVESQPSVQEIKSFSQPEPVLMQPAVKRSPMKSPLKSPLKAENEKFAMTTTGRPYLSNREEKLLRGSTDTSSVPTIDVQR